MISTRWRYKTLVVPYYVDPDAVPKVVTDLAGALNKEGDKGWEVVQMLADSRTARVFLLKMPIRE